VPLSTTPVVYLGETQIGAILQVFDAQTLTPRTVFKDGLATIPWLQASFGLPIPAGAYVTDASGRVPVGFVVGNPYRIRCISSKGQEIFDIDNLPGDVAAGGSGGGGGGGGTATLNTGDFVFAHTTAQITGRVRANGKTIGSLASGATERANGADHLHSDVYALYAFLWPDTSLVVSGGRGANAAADFDANKPLTLPDYNARTLFGIDGMGSTPTGRLANAIFATGSASVLGSTGGEGAHVNTLFETATHGHTGITLANAAFQMSFTTATAGSHNHTGTAIAVGPHTHAGSLAPSHVHDFSGMSFGGAHAHGGLSGGSDTFFQMNSTGISLSQTTQNYPTSASGASGFVAALTSSTLNLGLSGTYFQDHHHGISTDGSHIHGGATGASGNLTLSMVGDGSHGHSLSIALDGSHTHSGVTDLGGAHTHIFATDLSGGGSAHNNMPPFGLATCYIVL
jgi:hypothetical protein